MSSQSNNFAVWYCDSPHRILTFTISSSWSLKKLWTHLLMRILFPSLKGPNLLATIAWPCLIPLYTYTSHRHIQAISSQIRKSLHTIQVNFLFPYHAALNPRTKTGELETEKYEFLTITLEGHIYREIRAVSRHERFLCGVAVTGMMWALDAKLHPTISCRSSVPRLRHTHVHYIKHCSLKVQRK